MSAREIMMSDNFLNKFPAMGQFPGDYEERGVGEVCCGRGSRIGRSTEMPGPEPTGLFQHTAGKRRDRACQWKTDDKQRGFTAIVDFFR